MNIELSEMASEAYKTCAHIPDVKIPKEFIERLAELVAAKARKEMADEFAGLGEWHCVHIIESIDK
jgi:hypothetical protein